MRTIIVSFSKDLLYDRFCNDLGKRTEPHVEISESDRDWFEVTLSEASNVVLDELSRIAKDVDTPMVNTDDYVCFQVEPINSRQESQLPSSIEKALLAYIESAYFVQRMGVVVMDANTALLNLKYVTLINNGSLRKPAY